MSVRIYIVDIFTSVFERTYRSFNRKARDELQSR